MSLWKSLRLGGALVSLVGVTVMAAATAIPAGATPTGATSVGARSHQAPSPVGTYSLTTTIPGDPLTLEIEPNGNFQTTDSGCETEGPWVSQGSNIALFVVVFQVCTANRLKYQDLFIGTITKTGLNTASKPGTSTPYGDTWYATKTGELTSTRQPRASGQTSRTAGPTVNATPTGTYDEFFSNGAHPTITFGSHLNFTTSIGDSGIGITDGKTLALGVVSSTTGDKDCLSLGTIHGKLFNSKHKQGPSLCDAGSATWYAKKAPAGT